MAADSMDATPQIRPTARASVPGGTDNPIFSLLLSLGVISPEAIEEFYPRVRDRADVRVMRCTKSGVIFLSSAQAIDPAHYTGKDDFSYWSATTREQALLESRDDDERRARQFGMLIRQAKWLDVGTGAGGILDLLGSQAREACAVEPQVGARQQLLLLGHRVYPDIQKVPDYDFEIVTLFHVLEHLTDPVGTLRLIREKMVAGGKLIVEVPHARDFLITFLQSEAFKKFTFWSEHLMLHTRRSLDVFVREAGFTDVRIEGFQRYPLANHLYWLAKGEPGGHKHWNHLQSGALNRAYASLLTRLDKTDTLIAVADS